MPSAVDAKHQFGAFLGDFGEQAVADVPCCTGPIQVEDAHRNAGNKLSGSCEVFCLFLWGFFLLFFDSNQSLQSTKPFESRLCDTI